VAARYGLAVSESTLPLVTRLWFCVVCWLRVLFDGAFAARVWAVRHRMPALGPAESDLADDESEDDDALDEESDGDEEDDEQERAAAAARRADAIAVAPLQLLALLQREGRLIDFLQQEIADFDDADIGAAVRVVHEGCRKALHDHATVEPVREEAEDSPVRVPKGFDPSAIKLTGEVKGEPPYQGMLRHRGWRVTDLRLPEALEGHDFSVVAPAEVEL
jgi:hypothetical protein